MQIGLTYDLQTDPTDERQAEFDPPRTIERLRRALESLGHAVIPLGSAHELLRASSRLGQVELVFNIAEGSEGRCRESWVPMLLELRGVPYVGSDPLALAMGLDKVMTKRVAMADGIPTPRWISLERPEALPRELPLSFPVIVKPRHEGSGRGIDAGAVAQTREALARRVEWLSARCPQPLLIEELIPGGELTVCVIGNSPPVAYPAIQRPVDPVTRLACHVLKPAPSRVESPVILDEAIERQARRIALGIFDALGCRDVARVDLRVDDRGRLYLLEINPLPSFDPEGSFGLLAEYLGTTYEELVGRVLEAAVQRLQMSLRVMG